jgi:hypothetical protein
VVFDRSVAQHPGYGRKAAEQSRPFWQRQEWIAHRPIGADGDNIEEPRNRAQRIAQRRRRQAVEVHSDKATSLLFRPPSAPRLFDPLALPAPLRRS